MAETKHLEFRSNSDSWLIVLEWWKGLVGDDEKESGKRDRAGSAQLRRCKDMLEVVFIPAYQQLRMRLRDKGVMANEERLPAIAGLLAHIKPNHEREPIARQMACTEESASRPPISESRFRRLLRIKDRDQLYQPLVRVIRHLDRRINPLSLARDVYFWDERTRKRWADDYYLAALHVRDASEIEKGEE